MPFQSITVDDFSGGFTDQFVDNVLNRYERADNFIVLADKKFQSRPGSTLFDTYHFNVLAQGNPRIGAIINFEKDTFLLSQISKNLYYDNSGTWTTLLGPVTSNVVWNLGSTSSYVNSSEWNKTLFVTDDQFSTPMKIYRNENQALQVRTAGLESIELTGAINLANDLKSKFTLHIADTGEHTTADSVHTISSGQAYTLQTLITLISELMTDYAAHNADALLVTPTYHVATTTGHTLASTAAPRTLAECLTRLDDLKSKYNAHDADATAHNSASSHQEAVIRFPSATGTGTGANFIYSFHYYYTYQVGDVIFVDEGPTEQLDVNLNAPNSNNITISNIPTLSNKSTSSIGQNYDTANIKIKIYRTEDGGTIFYELATLDNGTTSYVDSTSDTTLAAGATLYTTGGVVDNDQPPPAKYVHVVNSFAYWCHIKEGSQTLTNRIRQSIQDDPDSAPADFFIDLDDEITGFSSMQSRPIAFTTKTAYRIEGNFDELGRGGMIAEKVTNASGCISAQSIVQTKYGLFYAGTDGFYVCDGYTVQKLSDQWNDTYKRITNTVQKQKRIVGAYEENHDRVVWTCQMDDSSPDNDSFVVLDLRFGLKPDSCFTTWSNGTDFSPTSVAYYNKEIVRSDRRGYLLKHQYSLYSDLEINTSVTPTSWNKKTIIWDYKSVSTDFGSSQIRKFVNRITFQAKNDSNTSIQINSINDDNRSFKQLKPIRWRGNVVWGDPLIVWGVTDVVWGLDGSVEELRRFAAGELRCNRKQIQITNALINIIKSDDYGTATVDAVAKTLTLNSSTYPLPDFTNLIDYYVSFSSDSYTANYKILTRVSDQEFTYQDNLSTSSSSATAKWVIRGYVKDERLHIIKYVIEFTPLTDSQLPYSSSPSYTGANA
jgi:hypothetical protein